MTAHRTARRSRSLRALAAVLSALLIVGAQSVLTPAAADTSAPAAPASWSLAGDWAAQWNAAGGPSNTATDRWQYFGVPSAEEDDPYAYLLADDSAPTTCAASGVDQVWRNGADGTNVHMAITDVRSRCAPHLTIPAGTVDIGPGGDGMDAGVMWTSPVTGTVSVTGYVWDNDHGGGDGVSWSLRDSAGAVLTDGGFSNGGEQALADGSGGIGALQSIDVTEGDTLIFLVNPNPAGGTGGNYVYDNTGVNLAITQLPAVPAGAVLTWGSNDRGQLGTGDSVARSVPGPTTLPDGTRIASVAVGDSHTLALTDDGTLYAWGDGTRGQLGDGVSGDEGTGDYHYSPTPTPVGLPDGVTVADIAAAGTTSLALTTAGDVYAWGANDSGQLGDGSTTGSAVPVRVHLPAGVRATAIATGGGTSLALADDGSVYSWGENYAGALGTGSPDYHDPTPARVALPEGTVIETVSAGLVHCLALTADGTVWAWGRNYNGGLGGGTTGDAATPIPVPFPDGVDVVGVSAGDVYSLAVDAEGNGYSWGSATFGLLGNGRTEDATSPLPVTLPAGVNLARVVAGPFTAMALTTTGRLLGWGNNIDGQLGDGTTSQARALPAPVPLPVLARVADLAVGTYTVAAVEDEPAHPSAALAATTPTSGTAPFTVGFDAGSSLAPEGASFVFDCGDGSVPAQAGFAAATATCTYESAGTYVARVTLRDPATNLTYPSDEITVEVAPPPPSVHLVADADDLAAGDTVHLTLDAGSVTPADATFAFHCGDSDATANSDPHATSADCTYHRASPDGGWGAWVSMHDPATGRDYQDTVFVTVSPAPDTVDGSAAFGDSEVARITVASDGSMNGDTGDCGDVHLELTTCLRLDDAVLRFTAAPGTFAEGTVVHVYRGDTDTLQAELGPDVQAQGGFAMTWTPAVTLTQPLMVTVQPDANVQPLRASGPMRALSVMAPMGFDLGGFFRGVYDGIVGGIVKVVQTVGRAIQAAANGIGGLWQSATASLNQPNGSDTNNILFCATVSTDKNGKIVCTGATVFTGVGTESVSSLVAGGRVIAAGGGNVIAAGGGNVIAAGGGNVIAAGGGNILADVSGGYVIAAGGGNVIAAGGGNVIAAGGGNVIAAGGGNVIAAGGGNITFGLTQDPGFAFAQPADDTPPTVTATASPEQPESGTYPAGSAVTVHLGAASGSGAPILNVNYSTDGAVSTPYTIAAGDSTDVVIDQPGLTTISYSAQDAGLNRAVTKTLEIRIDAPAEPEPQAPAAPTNVQAIADDDLTSATLSWTAPADPDGAAVTGYTVQVIDLGTIGGDGSDAAASRIVDFESTDTTQTLTGLVTGHGYQLVLAASNGVMGTVADVHLDLARRPAAPTGLTATAGDAQVVLTWDALGTAGAATGGLPLNNYFVYRAESPDGQWTKITTASDLPTAPTWTDTTVSAGHTYYYKVDAENPLGEGAFSPVVSATPTSTHQAGGTGGAGGAGSGGGGSAGAPVTQTTWSSTDHTPSSSTPVVAAVTGPNSGRITFTGFDAGAGATPVGFTLLGSGFVIDAPPASPDTPLVLTFRVDNASLPPGVTGTDLTVFRDGTPVSGCADPDAARAEPDPCVRSVSGSDGVTTLVVLSSHASTWTLGSASAVSPARLKLDAGRRAVAGGTARLAVRVWNSDGSFAARTAVAVTVTGANRAGGTVTTGADGFGTFSYTPTRAGTDTVTATVNGHTATIAVRIHRPAQHPVLSAASFSAGTVNVAVQTHPAVLRRKIRMYQVFDPGPGKRKVLRYLGFAITDDRGRAHAVLALPPGRTYVLRARMAGRDYIEYLSPTRPVTSGDDAPRRAG